MKKSLFYLTLILLLASCGKKPATVTRPAFSSDSAYAYVAHQLAFGPRVPNGNAHLQCGAWIYSKLNEAGADVMIQRGVKPDYSGRAQQVLNIVAHFGRYDRPAILLCAHYDTRPWCDQEEQYEERFYNVPGANDGASGVAVLLEVARQISLMDSARRATMSPVEIVLFDCEDMGTPTIYTGPQREDTWCLGSQVWAEQQSIMPRLYQYGVLLDMVGAPDAVFPREYYSEQLAGNYTEMVWQKASKLGYGYLFSDQFAYPITDDHIYVNQAGVPCLDIVHYDPSGDTGFAWWWHTRHDDLDQISRSTLQAVGEVIMSLLD